MEAVILCGIQASGKTTYYRDAFLHTHVRISLDLLRTRNREARFLAVCLDTRMPFVVDKVNATEQERARYVVPARAAGYRVIGVLVEAPASEALERNARRAGRQRVPVPAILGTRKHFEPLRAEEGFDELWRVRGAPGGAWVREPLQVSAAAP